MCWNGRLRLLCTLCIMISRRASSFRQAVESPKSWNLMGQFCPKNTFLQIKHIPYLTLLSTTCVKTDQITYVIFDTICDFSRHNSSVLFLAQILHTFYKSVPSKCKFSDFPLLKLAKFLMSFFKQKVRFSSKFGSFFSVIRDNASSLF